MALFQRIEDEGVLLGIWKMEESEETLCAWLPEEVVQASRCFTAPHRRMEWLTARVLLRTLLDGTAPEVVYTEMGAPALADGSHALSISHTRGYVAVLLAPPAWRVGVDIEQWGARVHRVAPRFMAPCEVPACYQGATTASLLLHWSAKETLYKCLDEQEGVDFSEHLRVMPFPVSDSGTFEAQALRTARGRRFRVNYRLYPDFVLTYTTVPA